MLAIPALRDHEYCLMDSPGAPDLHLSYPIHILLTMIWKMRGQWKVGSHCGLAEAF